MLLTINRLGYKKLTIIYKHMTNARYISYWLSTKTTTLSKINNTALKFRNVTSARTVIFKPLRVYLNVTKSVHTSLSNFTQRPTPQINTTVTIKNCLLLLTRSTLICWIKTLEFSITTLHFLFKTLAEKFIRQSTAVNVKKKLKSLTLLNMNSKYI